MRSHVMASIPPLNFSCPGILFKVLFSIFASQDEWNKSISAHLCVGESGEEVEEGHLLEVGGWVGAVDCRVF